MMYLENKYGDGFDTTSKTKSPDETAADSRYFEASLNLTHIFGEEVPASEVKDYVASQSKFNFEKKPRHTDGGGAYGRQAFDTNSTQMYEHYYTDYRKNK
jgi:hypothetical protein